MTGRALDLTEAAAVLGMSREWLRKQVTAQLVPCQRYGRTVRFTPEQIALIQAAHEQPLAPPIRPRLAAVSPLADGRPSSPPTSPPPPPRPVAPPKATTRKARSA